ncbi:MAG: hypothetical protein K9K81_10440 [Desulfobacteraceae bacterium]|nr:hypothetical protein [Desulfobacteraceae bacterium]
MSDLSQQKSTFRSWLVIAFLVLLVLAKGLFAFSIVGDRAMPDWSYGTIEDVPASSPYADYPLPPHPQHIRGSRGQ